MNGRAVATLVGAVGIALWATETALITFTARLPPLQTVALAFGAAALLAPFAWWAARADPLAAFRQPLKVWIVTVGCLVAFHACVYYAVQNAPAAPAALLQGTTPLMIVLGSAFLPGERLRWWHVAGAAVGFGGVLALISGEGGASASDNPGFYLALVGIAAALWGIYSLLTRTFADVPTSAMGAFFFGAALLSGLGHLLFEAWIPPSAPEWVAIAALGAFPMGLALYFWDFGLKRGDLQALGGLSYFEPFLGALFVVLVGQGDLRISMVWAGILVVGGAALASRGVWDAELGKAVKAPSVEASLHGDMRRLHRSALLEGVNDALGRLVATVDEIRNLQAGATFSQPLLDRNAERLARITVTACGEVGTKLASGRLQDLRELREILAELATMSEDLVIAYSSVRKSEARTQGGRAIPALQAQPVAAA